MDRDQIPVAVVGAGNMGWNHIRVYDEHPQADLVEVVEPDSRRAREIRDTFDVSVLESPDAIRTAEAASVTVPNEQHRTVAERCIEMGLDILVEKPLAPTVRDASAIVDVATDHDAILLIGHIERFNPAIEALEEILKTEEVISMDAHRLGPFNKHLTQESVVLDLMIHDLDVINGLLHSEHSYLDALGTVSRSKEIDHATAHMEFDDGTIATATASHVTHGKVRTLDVTTRDAFIRLNYQEQDLIIQHHGVEEMTQVRAKSGYRTETVTETPYLKTGEPLKNEIRHFLHCVEERTTPRVSGRDGVDAVRLASEVIQRIRDH